MLVLVHENDGKEEHDSHVVYFKETDGNFFKMFNNTYCCLSEKSIYGISSRGKDVKEAIDGIRNALEYLVKEYEAILKLYDAGYYEENIVERKELI